VLDGDDVVVTGLVGESGRWVWRSGRGVDGDDIQLGACGKESALESLRMRRDCRDLDTAVGRMVSLVGRFDQGHSLELQHTGHQWQQSSCRLSLRPVQRRSCQHCA